MIVPMPSTGPEQLFIVTNSGSYSNRVIAFVVAPRNLDMDAFLAAARACYVAEWHYEPQVWWHVMGVCAAWSWRNGETVDVGEFKTRLGAIIDYNADGGTWARLDLESFLR